MEKNEGDIWIMKEVSCVGTYVHTTKYVYIKKHFIFLIDLNTNLEMETDMWIRECNDTYLSGIRLWSLTISVRSHSRQILYHCTFYLRTYRSIPKSNFINVFQSINVVCNIYIYIYSRRSSDACFIEFPSNVSFFFFFEIHRMYLHFSFDIYIRINEQV